MMFIRVFVYCCILIPCITGQSTINEFCYKNARNELDKVLHHYKDPPSFSVPDEFQNIKNLINRIKIIISKIKDSKMDNQLNDIEDNLNKTRDQLRQIKVGGDLLKDLKTKLEQLEGLEKTHNKTRDECISARENFNTLQKDYEQLEKQGEKANQTIAKVKTNIEDTTKISKTIKRKLEEVKIPIDLSELYLCEKDIFKSIKEIIKKAMEIKDFFQKQRDKIKSDLQELKEKLKLGKVDKLPDIPLTKKQLKKDINYFQAQYEEAVKLKDAIDQKEKVKSELQRIKRIAFHLCKNGVCALRQSVTVEN